MVLRSHGGPDHNDHLERRRRGVEPRLRHGRPCNRGRSGALRVSERRDWVGASDSEPTGTATGDSVNRSAEIPRKARKRTGSSTMAEELQRSQYRAQRAVYLSSDEAERSAPVPANATGGSRR
jgi:hypothetical protein